MMVNSFARLVKKRNVTLYVLCVCFLIFFDFRSSYVYLLFRKMSINYGDGECEWTPPNFAGEDTADSFKTLVVGYPGGSKRLVYQQMEGLTGIATNDEWPYRSNRKRTPFWKSNYPHHEGSWNWKFPMDQSLLVLRNPRHAIKEYYNNRWDVDFTTTVREADTSMLNLYVRRPELIDFHEWSADRTSREIHWYGWHIDYWMEGGLLRDVLTHKLTTGDHFEKMLQRSANGDDGSLFFIYVGDERVSPEYDEHCVFDMPDKCQPKAIVSVERLLNPNTGPNETAKIAATIQGKGVDVIEDEAWTCIWEELLVRRKGPRTMLDRVGPPAEAFNFTTEEYVEMLIELNRLKDKYNSVEWSLSHQAQDLVTILDSYIFDISEVIVAM